MATVKDLSGNSPKGFTVDPHIADPNSGGGSIDTTGLMLDATGQAINSSLNAPIAYLPPEPVAASGDTTLSRAAAVSISTATTTLLVAGTASQFIRVHRLVLTIAAAQTITFKTGSTVLAAFDFPTTGGMLVLDFCSYPWFKTAITEDLNLTTTTTAAVKGMLDYVKGV